MKIFTPIDNIRFSNDNSERGIKGLKNIELSCYMNSIIQ